MKVYFVHDLEWDDSFDCQDLKILAAFDSKEKAVRYWQEYEHKIYAIRYTSAGQPANPDDQIMEYEVQ